MSRTNPIIDSELGAVDAVPENILQQQEATPTKTRRLLSLRQRSTPGSPATART
jgi:hypothetical protein